MPAPKLYYFNGTGLAEPIRLAFVVGGIEFEDVRFEPAQWPALKSTFPNGTVPVLEMDGVKYVESGAILSYVCTKAGLWPTDPLDVLKMMQVVQYCNTIYTKVWHLYHTAEEQRPPVLETFMQEVPVCLSTLETLVQMKKADGNIDMADLILHGLIGLFESKRCGVDFGDIRTKWPAVGAAVDKVAKNEKVVAYYANKQ